MSRLIVIFVWLLAAALPRAYAQTFVPLALPDLNTDIRTWSEGGQYIPLLPGTHVWNGVPFDLALDADGNNVFRAGTLEIQVGVFGVTQAYTIINSAFGRFGSVNGSIEFLGDTAYHRVDLVQGINVRDHYQSNFNNVIDNVNAIEAFSEGLARLDQQIYVLPPAFAGEWLHTIRFTGINGGYDGDPFIAAATVAVVPEPSTVLSLALGYLVVASRYRKRRPAA